ncbi:hypothetical protein DPMN_092853 [Dreissena polymorpha]|uniref:Uncharacterized protein n=1 Tax=Dreissena polymorpha TaxID=45954 RepID=A0A9D4R1D4_DREPO|nr:hypothetical protein DPMN_092853 [Dreissena polymorpha]
MSQHQRAAALLRQAADLLNVNTCDRSTLPTPVTSVSSTSAAKAIFAPDSKRRRHEHVNTGTVAVSALDYYTQVLSGRHH